MAKSRAAAPRRAKAKRAPTPRADTPRIADMIDLATDVKRQADMLGERFLAYLLAMAIQEMSQIDKRRPSTSTLRDGQEQEPTSTPSAD